ncbi:MAG TPA: 3-dehydroquinate synthase family protein [Allosphingosinicella sp.]|nr:3-dehydroquinate synthase family protein [Allosphingosinicella sp.]
MIEHDRLGYPIRIGSGLLDQAELPGGRLFLVTDQNVADAGWPDRLHGDFCGRFVLPPGESSKTMKWLEKLLDAMIEAGIRRSDHVVAVGGGMVGDLAGLAAALLKRGCGWVAVPTSLIAQADSAIGGKTGVNTRHGKNLIGAFHPPALVLIDPDALSTLPARELRSGYAEVVKYGLIGDETFFAWCEEHGEQLLNGEPSAQQKAIDFCVRAKSDYVAGDERDLAGQRALLNFGHSFGHAIEAETGMLHGEAVAIGMTMAFNMSVDLGYCLAADAKRAVKHLEESGLPTATEVDPRRLAARMRHDKKEGALVLTHGIGRAFLARGIDYSG